VIFHSDSEYVGAGDLDVRLPVGREGQCWDNAVAESFFATIKTELLDRHPWPTKAKAHKAIFQYVETSHQPSVSSRTELIVKRSG
jgi:transposase InsO family protein